MPAKHPDHIADPAAYGDLLLAASSSAKDAYAAALDLAQAAAASASIAKDHGNIQVLIDEAAAAAAACWQAANAAGNAMQLAMYRPQPRLPFAQLAARAAANAENAAADLHELAVQLSTAATSDNHATPLPADIFALRQMLAETQAARNAALAAA